MYALFSVANEYDQPANDLVCLWKDKPSLEEIAAAIKTPFPNDNDEITIQVVNLWKGENVRIYDHYDCRLQKVQFGKSFWDD